VVVEVDAGEVEAVEVAVFDMVVITLLDDVDVLMLDAKLEAAFIAASFKLFDSQAFIEFAME
jgi:hypothetical protein